MKLKQQVYDHYKLIIDDKVKMLQQVLADLKESGSNETKSTAGDKHETALAMLQIEQANTRAQLQEVLNQKAAFEKIDPSLTANIIVTGSLIKTNRMWLFISVALGKAAFKNISVIALSPQSPLGQILLGLKVKDTIVFNNMEYTIESIE